MTSIEILRFLNIAEKLKCELRHSWTSSNRQESVAEHSWRLCLFTFILKNEFKDYDMDKVIEIALDIYGRQIRSKLIDRSTKKSAL